MSKPSVDQEAIVRAYKYPCRSNIGNAKIDGLTETLHLNENKFNITYVAPQPQPTNGPVMLF